MRHFSFALGMTALLGVAVCSCADPEIEPLAIQLETLNEFQINGGETISIPYTLENLTQALASVTATSDNAEFATSVQPATGDPFKGTISVTAPKYIFDAQDVTVTVKAVDNGYDQRNCSQTFSIKPVLTPGLAQSSTAANSFIVPTGSLFGFVPYKGNSSAKAGTASISLLWQDKAGMVEDLFVMGEYVYVKLAQGVSGNAVICAGDATSAEWSWNLWVSDYSPEENAMEYTNSEGKNLKFMDRNLGATSSKAGSDAVNGNFYQWGRKDAFAGSNYEGKLKTMYNLAGEEVTKTITPCPEADNCANGIANPLTHYSGASSAGNWSWLSNNFASAPTAAIADYWGGVSAKKSQYDPCPAGWRVPTEKEMGFYTDSNLTFTKTYKVEGSTANADFLGWTITISGKDFFFPSQGEVAHGGALANSVGTTWPCGKLWTATSDTMASQSYFRGRNLNISPSSRGVGGIGYGYALPVRCVKE